MLVRENSGVGRQADRRATKLTSSSRPISPAATRTAGRIPFATAPGRIPPPTMSAARPPRAAADAGGWPPSNFRLAGPVSEASGKERGGLSGNVAGSIFGRHARARRKTRIRSVAPPGVPQATPCFRPCRLPDTRPRAGAGFERPLPPAPLRGRPRPPTACDVGTRGGGTGRPRLTAPSPPAHATPFGGRDPHGGRRLPGRSDRGRAPCPSPRPAIVPERREAQHSPLAAGRSFSSPSPPEGESPKPLHKTIQAQPKAPAISPEGS